MGVTNVQLSDQILMCNGAPLDPAKDLAAYALPVSPTVLSLSTLAPPLCESECWVGHHLQGTDASGTKDVFLYNKSHLRLHGEPAPVETARPLAVDGETCQTACPWAKGPTGSPMLSLARCVQSRHLQWMRRCRMHWTTPAAL